MRQCQWGPSRTLILKWTGSDALQVPVSSDLGLQISNIEQEVNISQNGYQLESYCALIFVYI